jgi:hypothetical protein
MSVALDKPIKREVRINGEPHTLTLDADGVTIVRKGARKGFTVTWASLVEGSPQMQLDLLRSIQAARPPAERASRDDRRPAKKRA